MKRLRNEAHEGSFSLNVLNPLIFLMVKRRCSLIFNMKQLRKEAHEGILQKKD
jgi:hypothetical protein